MKTLCIDIGNTSAHWGLLENGKTRTAGHIPTQDIEAALPELLRRMEPEADSLAWCSVSPKASDALDGLLERSDWKTKAWRLRWNDCPGLSINYPAPEEIGEDRLANALAAQEAKGAPAIVIDMGTAVTFDILTDSGYEGGVIAPGLAVMARYLKEQTALLPEIDPEDLLVSSGIGKSTIEAMKLGCAVGFEGMIRALLDRVKSELAARGEREPSVIATGGSAGALPTVWLNDLQWMPDLTLFGLAMGAERKKSAQGH